MAYPPLQAPEQGLGNAPEMKKELSPGGFRALAGWIPGVNLMGNLNLRRDVREFEYH
jgi:hypothetical protein